MTTVPWEFVLESNGFTCKLLVVVGSGVPEPIGPRMERGEPVPEKFMTSLYDSPAEALKAKAYWEDYYRRVVSQVRKKAKR